MSERDQLEQLLRLLLARTETGALRWDASGDGCFTVRLSAGSVQLSERDGVVVRNHCDQPVAGMPPGELVRSLLREAALTVRHPAVVLRDLIGELDRDERQAILRALPNGPAARGGVRGRFSPFR